MSLNRISGLDSLRFVCALWVMIGHIGPPPASYLPAPLDGMLGEWLKMAVSGPAAVIVFFLISGLVIHYPNRAGGQPRWGAFLLRRFVRILLPLAAALAVGALAGVSYAYLESTILWSLFAELIYYACYPLLLNLRRAFGWDRLIGASFALALGVVLMVDSTPDTYHAFGHGLNWLVGLPCWLLGCRLAESLDGVGPRAVGNVEIWLCRLGIWGVSVVCLVLNHQTPVAYAYTLNVFAFLVYVWLEREVRRFRVRPPLRWLEQAGEWSYSLYLFHLVGVAMIHTSLQGFHGHPPPIWPTLVVGDLLLAYLFFRLFERPAHHVAKRWSERLGQRPSVPAGIMRS